MQMYDDGGAAFQPDVTQAPGQALAEEKVVAVVKRGVGEEFAISALCFPDQCCRQAGMAGLARRGLHCAAVLALLQLEAAGGRPGGGPERATAARRPRQGRDAGAPDGG